MNVINLKKLDCNYFNLFIRSCDYANGEVTIAFMAIYADDEGKLPEKIKPLTEESLSEIDFSYYSIPAFTISNILDGLKWLNNNNWIAKSEQTGELYLGETIRKIMREAHDKL